LSRPNRPALAAIFGCAGPVLTAAERDFFRDADPLGFILFQRNVEDPGQVRALVAALRETVGREAPVLIDQEGGRVQRLRPPHWRAAPSAARLAALPEAARAVWLNARLIAADLAALGIDVDCAPVLDVPVPGAHGIIGDRAYGSDPAVIAMLGRVAMRGLEAGGVLPVIKHVPGHGRARVDSHEACPVVDAPAGELESRDLVPFQALADAPFAMTAHVVYRAWDPEAPATLSAPVIEQVIRGLIGFHGTLLSDDLSMKALTGTLGERARRAIAAGCDVALHCNGDLREMSEIAGAIGPLQGEALACVAASLARRRPPEPADRPTLMAELDSLLDLEA
jgi:beta-N-acetylhexosaminidase